VWRARDSGAPLGCREARDGGIEIHVCAAIAKEISEMLAQ
jgi:hypothetical protein